MKNHRDCRAVVASLRVLIRQRARRPVRGGLREVLFLLLLGDLYGGVAGYCSVVLQGVVRFEDNCL